MRLRNIEFREIKELQDPGCLYLRLPVRENPSTSPQANALRQAQGSRKCVPHRISGKWLPTSCPPTTSSAAQRLQNRQWTHLPPTVLKSSLSRKTVFKAGKALLSLILFSSTKNYSQPLPGPLSCALEKLCP